MLYGFVLSLPNERAVHLSTPSHDLPETTAFLFLFLVLVDVVVYPNSEVNRSLSYPESKY